MLPGSPKRPARFSQSDNPCVRNCCLDDQDVCLGCGRTLTDITGWSRLSDAQKQQVLQDARARLQAKGRF